MSSPISIVWSQGWWSGSQSAWDLEKMSAKSWYASGTMDLMEASSSGGRLGVVGISEEWDAGAVALRDVGVTQSMLTGYGEAAAILRKAWGPTKEMDGFLVDGGSSGFRYMGEGLSRRRMDKSDQSITGHAWCIQWSPMTMGIESWRVVTKKWVWFMVPLEDSTLRKVS